MARQSCGRAAFFIERRFFQEDSDVLFCRACLRRHSARASSSWIGANSTVHVKPKPIRPLFCGFLLR